ncbi:MAG: mevalonate kinase [Wenzhouxiangella sp.]
MTTVTASAPGKAVLLGEYAVLEGSPALVMAIERRARVRIEPCPSGGSRVEVPQLGPAPVEYRLAWDGRIAWFGPAADQPAFQRARVVLEWLVARYPDQFPAGRGLRIRIATDELYQAAATGPTKLGLGSSAAMTVALAGAMEALAEPAPSGQLVARLENALLAPYRAGQDGRGSGIDLAASLHGGVCRYQLAPDGARAVPVAWPGALKLAFVWTGQAASTPDFLDHYPRWRASSPGAAMQAQQALDDACRAGLESLERDDALGLMTCINNYGRLMGKIGDLAGLPVVSEALRHIAEIASAHGLACKPCGAGGGDLAMLAGTDEEALDRACRMLASRGWPRLGLNVAPKGLQVETGPG